MLTHRARRGKNAEAFLNTHVQTYGWQNYAYDEGMAGTSGQAKRLEGIHINLVDKPYSGDIVYRTHVQTYGWLDWARNGGMAGTSGLARRLEGIKIVLVEKGGAAPGKTDKPCIVPAGGKMG